METVRVHYLDDTRSAGLQEQRLSVLLTDIAESTRLAARIGSERFGELLNRYYQRVFEAVAASHGEHSGYSGDGILAVFGRKSKDGSHSAHAVSAALDILASVDQLSYEFKEQIIVGVGIETGTVIAGYVDTGQRLELTVLGDVVHIAEKLQSIARPNRLLVGPTASDGLPHEFITRQLGSIRIDDRSVKVDIFEVQRPPA